MAYGKMKIIFPYAVFDLDFYFMFNYNHVVENPTAV